VVVVSRPDWIDHWPDPRQPRKTSLWITVPLAVLGGLVWGALVLAVSGIVMLVVLANMGK
jgi:hypothetical protein